jgi:hypothetical protein
MFIYQSFGWY